MVIMGGGPENPSSTSSGEKELILCGLPWTDEEAKKGVDGLKEEFKDFEVKYFHTPHVNGAIKGIDVPEGMYRITTINFGIAVFKYRQSVSKMSRYLHRCSLHICPSTNFLPR
jgi:hypothetical protein